MRPLVVFSIAAFVLSACAVADDQFNLAREMSPGAYTGAKLKRALAEASVHPLGSFKNPVRVALAEGELAYLRALRCSDGSPIKIYGRVSTGPGPFGNIVDGYTVGCAGVEPREVVIYMDMYHFDHVETAAPPGFTHPG